MGKETDERLDRDFAHLAFPLPHEKPPSTPANHPLGSLVSLPNGQMHEGIRSNKTRERRKWLLPIIIGIVVLTIIGSAGTLFFSIRDHATDSAYPGYLTGKGQLVFFDPLSQAGGSKWHSSGSSDATWLCQFTGGVYHVSEPSVNYRSWCTMDGVVSNFVFEVQLTIMQGDCGGIMFRNNGRDHYYYFHICESGSCLMAKFFDNLGSHAEILSSNNSCSAIHTGLGQKNKIAVVASGSSMNFYINEQQIDQVQDSSYTSGSIELIAAGYSHTTDVAYSNARLWTL